MKIRTGFVSNSSSSSFVCLYKKDEVDEILHTLTGNERMVFDKVTQEDKLFGIDVYLFEIAHSNGYSSWEDLYIEGVEDLYDVWDGISDKLRGISQWSWTVDM